MIKSIGKRLIVEQTIEEKKEEKKGLIIPGDDKKPIKALVIAAGTDVDYQVHPGEYVLINSWVGTHIEIEGKKYISILEEQILAVLKP